MNKDQVKGRIDELAGKAQKNLGDAINSPEQEAKGTAKEIKGKVQKTYGDAKEDVKDEVRREDRNPPLHRGDKL